MLKSKSIWKRVTEKSSDWCNLGCYILWLNQYLANELRYFRKLRYQFLTFICSKQHERENVLFFCFVLCTLESILFDRLQKHCRAATGNACTLIHSNRIPVCHRIDKKGISLTFSLCYSSHTWRSYAAAVFSVVIGIFNREHDKSDRPEIFCILAVWFEMWIFVYTHSIPFKSLPFNIGY